MRLRAIALLTALALAPAGSARAQEEAPAPAPAGGFVDFGVQLGAADGDASRFQRYGDLRDGPLVRDFLFRRDLEGWSVDLAATHIGYRDQKYAGEIRRYGRFRLTASWDQIPLFFSTGDRGAFGLLSATPYTRVAPGEYRIDDTIQQSLQNICPRPPCAGPAGGVRQALLFQQVSASATPLDIRHQRDVALVDARVHAFRGTDLLLRFQNTLKEGTQPWSASFGFSAAVELPGPVDHRTTEFGAHLEWAGRRGLAKVGWDGSWFNNSIETLVWDNPLRITDFSYGSAYSPGDGTSQGRMAMWPDSTQSTFSGVATYNLARRTKAYGNLSLSDWSQNQRLLPHTINTAVHPIPLARETAEAEALVTAGMVGLSSRPIDRLWLNVRYKRYDYDNQTTFLPVTEYVRLDQVEEEFLLGPGTPLFAYTRQYFDADASVNVLPFTALRVGFTSEADRREFREFEKTRDNGVRVALDTTGWSLAMFRIQYDYAKRTGEGLDEEVFDAENEGYSIARQFDISDRNRNRFSVITAVTPSDLFSVDAQVGIFRDERPDSHFGLLESSGDFYSLGVNVTPSQRIGFGVTYGYDRYSSLQRSRQQNPGPQQTDPRRDWTTDVADDVHSLFFNLDVLKVLPRTDVRYSFDWMDGVNDITYGLRPDQTIFASAAQLRQLPRATHELRRSMLDVLYFLNRRLGVGVGWIYDDYQVDDWAWNQDVVNGLMLNPPAQGGQQFLALPRYLYRPYTGNLVTARLRYLW